MTRKYSNIKERQAIIVISWLLAGHIGTSGYWIPTSNWSRRYFTMEHHSKFTYSCTWCTLSPSDPLPPTRQNKSHRRLSLTLVTSIFRRLLLSPSFSSAFQYGLALFGTTDSGNNPFFPIRFSFIPSFSFSFSSFVFSSFSSFWFIFCLFLVYSWFIFEINQISFKSFGHSTAFS